MLARIRENWKYKILAIICAIALRYYVNAQQNPQKSRPVTMTLAIHNLPSGLVIVDKPINVSVTLTGSNEDLGRINDSNVSALVDLRNTHAGLNSGLPVDVSINPPGLRNGITISEVKPRVVALQIDQKRKRRLPITVMIQGAPAPGFIVKRPVLITKSAIMNGPSSLVSAVSKLVIKPDVTSASNSIDDEFQIIPQDVNGQDVPNIQVTPDTAQVQINILQEGRSRDVFISPSITGSPAPGYVIGEVTSDPRTVTVSGTPGLLNDLGRILTEPVDITNATTDIVKQVKCLSPNGTKLNTTDVTITVKIIPANNVQPPAAPALQAQPPKP